MQNLYFFRKTSRRSKWPGAKWPGSKRAGAQSSQPPDGGAERDRTADLRSAIAALSQLSYGPVPAKEQAKQ
jgi:hypothetical protein